MCFPTRRLGVSSTDYARCSRVSTGYPPSFRASETEAVESERVAEVDEHRLDNTHSPAVLITAFRRIDLVLHQTQLIRLELI